MKKMLILVLSLILCACNNNSYSENIKTVMKEKDYVIIDVRTENEYLESHISEAINIPYDEINEDIDIDKDNVVFVYCKSGAKSEAASNILTNLGYDVYDLGAFSEIDLSKE